uniref:Trifunctional enzyme subunit alpha, mitochondrial n=1 Tax=Syphacia muris TaxID=451379 RepID=A0A0N5AT83_9BILA
MVSGTALLEVEDDVAVIRLNCSDSKENVLNKTLSEHLREALERVESDNSIRSVVIMSAKPNSFIAGADINMISQVKTADEGRRLSLHGQQELLKIERSRKPIVAAVMGSCMGGGLELAMACHYRIAVNTEKTVLGLPEVLLGLLPGAGGTQRLPKLVPITNALDMLLTGKALKPYTAKKIGLIDHIVDPIGAGMKSAKENNMDYLKKVAVSVAKQLACGKLEVNRQKPFLQRALNYIMTSAPFFEKFVLKAARKKIMKQTYGKYPAPLKILEVVKAGFETDDGSAYDQEAEAFGKLSQTDQCKALIGIFKSSNLCKKNKWGELTQRIDKMAVVGAGLMGAGIANVSVDKGIKTTLIDVNDACLARGLNQVYTNLDTLCKKKRISGLQRDKAISCLKASTSYGDLSDCRIAIEAVFEEIDLKRKIVTKLESVVPENCVIASNTSALPISKIAYGSKKPERVIGMHYFSPVDKMKLLEVITTPKTDKETLKVATNLGLINFSKIFFTTSSFFKDSPGFFVVRCLAPMMSEISRLLQEGVQPSDLDELTRSCGFPVGAATLADEVGLDVAEHVAKFLGKALGARIGGGSVDLLSEMVAKGCKGRKSGSGYFIYGKGRKRKVVNEKALRIILNHRITPPISVSGVEDRQLRILCRYINEAALCLQEEVIASPDDGDVASVFGIGFPPFWGGPFRFLDLYGIDKLLKHMSRFADVYNAEQFKPAQILVDYAKQSKKFYSSNM